MPSRPTDTPAGGSGRLTPGSRSSRRDSSTWRRPRPSTRPRNVTPTEATTISPAPIRKPRRGDPVRRPGRRPGRLGTSVGPAIVTAQALGEDGQAQDPGHEAHDDRQQVGGPGARLRRDRDAGQDGDRCQQGHRLPPRPARQPPGPGEQQGEHDEEHDDQERLVVGAEDADGPLDDRSRRETDDHLGDRDDRRLADRHHHRHEVAGGEAGRAGDDAGQPPGVPGVLTRRLSPTRSAGHDRPVTDALRPDDGS